ncbi:hypothetical protein [Halomonas maura]|uniref:hypothetical protein n=1 Tax=Halomonas maura TaxID=117606 RepID=UPI0025B2C70B|nr:hypothetical protein [Halomonas maura]MDN3554614.1 hypothetical protein [Halomonas maura]
MSAEDLEALDHRAFDVIGAIPRHKHDPRAGIYIVLKEESPYASRLLVEVDDPDCLFALSELRRRLDL